LPPWSRMKAFVQFNRSMSLSSEERINAPVRTQSSPRNSRMPFLSIFSRRLLAALGLMAETEADVHGPTKFPRWLCWAAIIMLPLSYIASESGWLVAEMGRQPWTIQDMLPTWAAVSDLQAGSVALTFVLFLLLFTTMLGVEISIMLKQIKKGPSC
ncbi:MAG: cytochrome ubiquinol oxidase subunit I, partial [Prevotella sp.]|nr:cytochrome ubiquinol oxidase subunit I [Prevotella sp.]